HAQEHHAADARDHSRRQRSAVIGEAPRGSQGVAVARGRQAMTVTKGLTLALSVTLSGALASASSSMAGLPAFGPRLTSISSRVHSGGASLVIEASAPVPYVATRPDPLTVLVDFRNVGAEGLANSVAANSRSPIASVAVEAADQMGVP